jgi:Trypsin-like peptidase domain
MFIRAIEIATQFTRPIHTIQRFHSSNIVLPGAATLFFVNADGWALTCRHVAQMLGAADQIAKRKADYEQDFAAMKGKKKEKQILRELEQKYQLRKEPLFELKNRFVNCVEGVLNVDIHTHQNIDVALLHFQNYTRLLCTSFPMFPRDTTGLKQGKFLCRLGFPFPEFTNFVYDQNTNTIDWTNIGRENTPIFPIEGMLTRGLLSPDNSIVGFEMSTPGLRGQSGGPAFDVDGRVWGMQSSTNHLDLDFDVDIEVMRNGQKKKVHDSTFLHVGHCVHVDILKDFMRQFNVTFQEQ